MNNGYLEPVLWYQSLPTVYVSAGVLVTDPAADQILLVQPNYRPHWSIPGGVVEDGEPPHLCAAREAAEELGLAVTLGDLLVIDWAAAEGDRPRPMLSYIFDGGTLADLSQIRLQRDELDEARFWPWDQAVTQLPGNAAARILAARLARKHRRTIYLPTKPSTISEPARLAGDPGPATSSPRATTRGSSHP